MNSQVAAFKAELLKSKHSKIFLISFIAFALVPIMGGVFMLVMQNPEAMANASLLNTKMEAMNVAANWNALFMILTQGMGIGGIMVYGFVTSWIFGREYSDKTVKDLLSLPTSRAKIINAKYIVYLLWSLALALSNLLLGVCIGMLLRLPGFDSSMLLTNIYDYFFTAVLTIIIGTPIAFFAMWGNGYLAPLGFVALLLVFSQIIAAIGYGQFFPWAIPALYSGVSGTYKDQLNGMSYFILVLIAATGYCITSLYWKYADQKK